MSEKLCQLVSDGFHRENLQRIDRECEGNIGLDPALYGPLSLLFRALLNGMDSQAVPSQRITECELALQKPIILLLRAGSSDPGIFRDLLSEVMRNAFAVLP